MSYPYIVNPQQIVSATVQNGFLTAALPPQIYDRKLVRMAIVGPSNSTVKVYQNQVSPVNLLDSTPRGDSNTADYPNPIQVPRNVSIIVVWDSAVGSASATFYLERA